MLELFQSIHALTAVFILAGLAILLLFGIRALRWPKAPWSNGRRADPRYVHLLRKTPF